MRVDLLVHVESQDYGSALDLPRGCGIEVASTAIEKATTDLKNLLIELFKANTEGRKPKLDHLEAK